MSGVILASALIRIGWRLQWETSEQGKPVVARWRVLARRGGQGSGALSGAWGKCRPEGTALLLFGLLKPVWKK